MNPLAPPPPLPPAGASRAQENRYLWRAFRHHSRTFSLATLLLPGRVRLPVATLYLYCRTVDQIADERVLAVGTEGALRELAAAREALTAALAGRPSDGLLWRRLAEVHARFGLLEAPLYELLDGAEWDLHGRPIHDATDLLAYSELVAGSVGAMMLPFLVADRADIPALEAPARALGKAMQVTNVLRDVGEDLKHLDRLYLPQALLDTYGVTRAELLHVSRNGRAPSEEYVTLVETVMERAEALFEEAEPGIRRLPLRARLGIEAAARMYREILNEIRAAGYDNLRRRSYVVLPRKLRLIAQDDYTRRKARLLDAQAVPTV